jgi:2-succinyl-5-enolpyruvyl-6-hydroxy-3-cyclohexene-1-carboxylate synthase
MLDFRNINTLWCSVLVETLVCLGLKDAVICPGSRSTPLTIALARHPQVKTIPILDERSAAFFALGKAKRTELPVVLLCSSGTAGANFYPAVIEARETGIPLIILTADRPVELRHCHAGQTIDQIKLYGNYPNWDTELALPEANREMLDYLRQNILQAWEKSLFPHPGVVHLNCPFREPLAPITQPEIATLALEIIEPDFFSHLQNYHLNCSYSFSTTLPNNLIQSLNSTTEGIIIGGLTQTKEPEQYCQEIALLSQKLQFPVLAEALSPLRNYAKLNPYLISTYATILSKSERASQLQPKVIIQIGELPTSKQLRNWLSQTQASRYIITNAPENFDPLHSKTIHLRTSLTTFTKEIVVNADDKSFSNYLQTWCELETKTQTEILDKMKPLEQLYEGKAAWLISQHLPPQTPIFLANSMTVRNAEFFWQPNNSQIIPYFNRGANGIDGTLSTALGIAYCDRPTVMLTGDLALLHDTNGFLINNHFSGHLTIILINNNGGGIFEMLSVAQFEPPFEEYFATPQNIDFARLCQTYNIQYQSINNWQQLSQLLNPLPQTGIRLLELKTNRKKDTYLLKNHFSS